MVTYKEFFEEYGKRYLRTTWDSDSCSKHVSIEDLYQQFANRICNELCAALKEAARVSQSEDN